MDSTIFSEGLFQLGGTVVTTGMFLWYLMHRNGKAERAMGKLFNGLEKLNESQERHTRVLINVAKSHKLSGDADDLMRS